MKESFSDSHYSILHRACPRLTILLKTRSTSSLLLHLSLTPSEGGDCSLSAPLPRRASFRFPSPAFSPCTRSRWPVGGAQLPHASSACDSSMLTFKGRTTLLCAHLKSMFSTMGAAWPTLSFRLACAPCVTGQWLSILEFPGINNYRFHLSPLG